MSRKIPSEVKVSVSGFRAKYPKPFSPDFGLALGSSIGTYFKGRRIVFGSDSRLTRDVLGSALKSGLTSTGCTVIDLGIVPTPTVEVSVPHFKASAGLILSASHNPAEWNAIKIVGSNGCFLSMRKIKKIISIYEKSNFTLQKYNRVGQIEKSDSGLNIHIENVISNKFSKKHIKFNKIKKSNFRIFSDVINATGAVILPPFFEKIGIKRYKLINPDYDIEFSRIPEPNKKNLRKTMSFLKRKRFNVCFVLDPDADRLAIIDEKGRYVSEEFTQVLAAESVLRYKKGPLVTNLSSSRLLDDLGIRYEVPVFRSPVGEANVVAAMKRHNAVIGGEGNGGVIWPDAHLGRDALSGILLILDLMATTGKKISDLVSVYPKYRMVKTKVYSKTGIIDVRRIKDLFSSGKINTRDGVKVIFPDSWIHIRPSGTEPVIRVIAEALTLKKSKSMINEVLKLIK